MRVYVEKNLDLAISWQMKQMKKIKVVQICVKWRENSSKVIFGILGPQPKKIGGRA